MANVSDILVAVKKISRYYRDEDKSNLPEPHKGENIRALFLGADPGTGYNATFRVVFGLEKGIESVYYRQFIDNLKLIGLGIDNLYIQNVCRNYFSINTGEHEKDWISCASLWLPLLKEELDKIDKERKMPILISAEIILKALLYQKPLSAERYYEGKIFVEKEENKLDRVLIPFFRGGCGKYKLSNPLWTEYKEYLKDYLRQSAILASPLIS